MTLSTTMAIKQSPMSESSIVRRIERVRHEIHRRETEVVGVERLGASFVSVRVRAESLKQFVSLSFDDHVKLMLPDGAGGWLMRDYTPRSFDTARGELVIEFALHGSGPFSDWARQAQPGQTLVVAGPRGSMIVPLDYDWHLLVGDDSAWPAIQRRLEELPADARAEVLLLCAEPVTQPQRVPSGLGFSRVSDGDALLQALRARPWPAGEGFVWCAGEARLMTAARELLLGEKRHPKEAMKVAAYWKPGAADFHERLEG